MMAFPPHACTDGTYYGAAAANTRFESATTPTVDSVSPADDFDILALRDHPGPSGVPLGGIGVGFFNLAPDGRITRIALNNTHRPPGGEFGKGCFFSLSWNEDGKQTVRRLVRDPSAWLGMEGFDHSTYTGLFPMARVRFQNEHTTDPVHAEVYAWSGFVPHNVKDSSLPVAWFEVTLTARREVEVSVALSWEDIIGREIRDPESVEGLAGQVFEGDRLYRLDATSDLGRGGWPLLPRVPTSVRSYKVEGWKGIIQSADRPLRPKKATFQGYVSDVAILAESRNPQEVTVLPAYRLEDGTSDWNSFRQSGRFNNEWTTTTLSRPDSPPTASAIARTVRLKPGEKRALRFLVAWYFPELTVNRGTAPPGSYFGTGDYGRYFHNSFSSLDDLFAYAVGERARIHGQTREWQQPLLDSTLPDWLKFKILNSAYTLYTNTILNEAGDFTVMEGGMTGLAGTMDQRICAHPAYQKFFPSLDRREMQLFADTRDPEEGYILHFVGHYYHGMATLGGRAPTEKNWMLDNTGGWIIQLAKDYQQTGDIEILQRNAATVRDGLAFLKSKTPEGVHIPVGPTTYDDFQHPPVYSYMAGMYLAILRAARCIGEAIGDEALVADCDAQFEKTREAMLRLLWNGRFFAYGCDLDGSNRRDDLLFTGQLAGQFVSRAFGWGNVLPMEMVRSSLVAQFETSLSHTPDYYANKVWDLNQNKGIDMPGSQCWPFYLEAYTALAAVQAGYVADGLDIIRHIQLVHLRNGWTWTQNLWNPGELTYMTAPVSWFIPDVLTGAGIDVPNQTLRLAPVLLPGTTRLECPVYFPRFWAMVTYEPARKTLTLKILKTFGASPVSIRRVVVEPAGRPSSESTAVEIPEFRCAEGETLDLSPFWDRLPVPALRDAVLAPAAGVLPGNTVPAEKNPPQTP